MLWSDFFHDPESILVRLLRVCDIDDGLSGPHPFSVILEELFEVHVSFRLIVLASDYLSSLELSITIKKPILKIGRPV